LVKSDLLATSGRERGPEPADSAYRCDARAFRDLRRIAMLAAATSNPAAEDPGVESPGRTAQS
jgi:hypothetical protein